MTGISLASFAISTDDGFPDPGENLPLLLRLQRWSISAYCFPSGSTCYRTVLIFQLYESSLDIDWIDFISLKQWERNVG